MTSRHYTSGQPRRSIAGASVLITGAANGMGAAAARLFAAEGAWVAATDRDVKGVESLVDSITKAGGVARAWALDVADRRQIAQVVAEAAATFDGLDCLINNAGFAPYAPIEADGFEAVWTSAIDIMLTAIPRAVRAALPWLGNSPFPRVVNIASTEACASTGNLSAYAAAKAGVIGITRALAVELGPRGITCNCILPGPIETGLTAAIRDEDRQTFARRRTALRRYGKSEEVAEMMLNLCLPGASYVTGATIPVDGGLLIRNG